MPANKVAENVLGTIGAICWTVQLIPQIWKSWRSKSTDGLSLWLVFLWGFSGPFLGVYAIVQDLNVPLILQPHLFAALCFVSWAQCLYYGKKRSRNFAVVSFLAVCVLLGGFEAGMVFAISPSFHAGHIAAVQFFGIMSSVVISLALLPQYYEIYKHKEVVGISIMFMLVDCLGGVFSDLSLAFKAKFNVIPAVTYSLVVVLDGIVLLLALILNPRAARRLRALKDAEAALPAPAIEDILVPAPDTNPRVDVEEKAVEIRTRDVPPGASHDTEKSVPDAIVVASQ
ncbi:hypothetical protein EUX98_g2169 [Antrodiella citrinella]|uniref:PQ-loop-domain-containing protein n=1 Tax=Antrodiella citrinella TaxID=2447956 RepID=A0A4S4MZP9_9APHY|nr:hypothetical protein EUX98_g2169 [Antrodiella citrinella]